MLQNNSEQVKKSGDLQYNGPYNISDILEVKKSIQENWVRLIIIYAAVFKKYFLFLQIFFS